MRGDAGTDTGTWNFERVVSGVGGPLRTALSGSALRPLTPAQRRLWLAHEIAPDVPALTITTAVSCRGPLNLVALQHAIRRICARHEVLRMTVSAGVHDDPMAKVSPALPSVALVDLSGLSGPGRSTQMNRLLADEAAHPFRLSEEYPARWIVVRLSVEHHVLAMTMNHIATDEESMSIVCRELEAAYGSAKDGAPDTLPEAGTNYWGATSVPDASKDSRSFWSTQMEGAPARTSPFVGGDPTGFPVRHMVSLSNRSTAHLRSFCAEHRATGFVVILSAVAAAIARSSGQDDLVIGTPMGNRSGAEDSALLGPVMNLVPIRIRCEDDPSAADLVQRVREAIIDAVDHRDLPFEDIVASAGTERDVDSHPLFQVLVVYRRAQRAPAFAGVTTELVNVAPSVGRDELTVVAVEHADRVELTVEARPRPGRAGDVARFAGRLVALLDAITTGSQAPVSQLQLVDAVDQRQLIVEAASCARSPAVHDVVGFVRRAARRTPDAVAVATEVENLSYRELVRRADRLSTVLRDYRVGVEDVVAVPGERGLDLIVSMLAVLGSGATCLLIDLELPAARVASMLADSGVSAVVAKPDSAASLSRHFDNSITLVNPSADPLGPVRRYAHDPSGQRLAWIVYTSGSTGVPKGVGITAAGAGAFVSWARVEFGEALQTCLATTSVGFDLFAFEVWATLAAGGTVVVAGSIMDIPEMRRASQATLLNTVPSAAAALLEIDGLPPSVLAVNLAGEALSSQLVDRLHDVRPQATVRNLYGPSEATTYATMARVPATRSTPDADVDAIIGRAIPPTLVWAADGRDLPVPSDVLGEIVIAGVTLARGYLGNSRATVESFRPAPLGPCGSRLYRTGDRARRRPDGALSFAGRTDGQVKIRGTRIELGEVESVLASLPGVSAAVVVAVNDDPSRRYLIGYVIAQRNSSVDERELLVQLKSRLPIVFVPGRIEIVDAFPMTHNGKTDRRALTHLGARRRLSPTPIVESRSEPERLVADIWCEILALDRVDVHSRFFDIGGTSLSILAVMGRLRAAAVPGLRIVDMFERPTVAGLAALVADAMSDSDATDHSTNTAMTDAHRRAARRLGTRRFGTPDSGGETRRKGAGL